MAIALGVALGIIFPEFAVGLKLLGDVFIRLIKMLIAPLVFCTIVLGIAGMGSLKQVGRVGGKALLYFEVVTTLALVIGLLVANWVQPGVGVAPPATAEAPAAQGEGLSWSGFLLHLVPENVVGAFATGDVLQVLVFALLFGVALGRTRAELRVPVYQTLERWNQVLFRILELIMRLAPLGAMGGMAYTVGKFGPETLLPLAKLMGAVYITMALFVFGVLNAIAWRYGFSLWRFLGFIRQEILIVLGTSSSESVLPRMIEKLERGGCQRSVVGLVIPTGYSFNLDGTTIYLSMAALFVAQVYGIQLSVWQQLTLVGILMITSKGAAGVTGSGFVVLASTLAALKTVPVEGVALLLGVDRFMSEARAITNLIGNGVATMVIARSENAFDSAMYADALARNSRGEEILAPAADIDPEVTDAELAKVGPEP